jgi:YD repeat-containing protein
MTPRPSTLTLAENERLDEVHRLLRLGAVSIPSLLEMLTEPSWAVRREVVGGLAQLGDAAVEPLCHVLRVRRDKESRIAAAVDTLVASTGQVLAPVTELARDSNPAIVADAAQILGRRGSVSAIPILSELVAHADDNVAVAAIEAVGRIGGPGAVDTLLVAIDSASFFRRFPAIDVLGRSGDPRAIPKLASLLKDPTYLIEAARALGKTGEAAAVASLAQLFNHPSEGILRIAAVALYELHERHRERFGGQEAPEEALRGANIGDSAARRLTRTISSADVDEQRAIAFVLGIVGGESAVSGLRGLLDLPGEPAQLAAASLKKLGRDSDLQVLSSLRDGTSARRLLLLPIVTRLSAAPEVAECLKDADPSVRALACDALGRIGAVLFVSRIFPLLAEVNPRVVQAATGAIQSLGSAETKALTLENARSSNPVVRRNALRVLAYFGFTEALPIFLEAMGDSDPRTIDAALVGLSFLEDPKALEALLQAAKSRQEKTRSSTMRALGQSARRDARVVACLLTGIKDPDAWVRYYACQALGRLGQETASEAIATLLTDSAGQVRVSAVEALSHFQNDAAFDALKNAAESGEPDVQRAALIGLGISKRPEALPVLLKAAKSDDSATRLVAISAVADTSSLRALPTLAAAARDLDENVRAAAIGFLAALPAPEATLLMIDLLKDHRCREALIPVLAVPNEGRVNGVISALANADDELAPVLTSALARMRTPDAALALVQTISSSESVSARKAAASALASLRTPEAVASLRVAAERDSHAQVRQICAVLLGE